jgi:transcriptional regulator with PAS, ATPase and Fis domain
VRFKIMDKIDLKELVAKYENGLIFRALSNTQNVQQAAEYLSIKRTTLANKITRAGITWSFCECKGCLTHNLKVIREKT